MNKLQSKLLAIVLMIFAGVLTGSVLAAGISTKQDGIGGTGAPAMHGGIGGTGLHPTDEVDKQTLAGKVLFIVGKVEAENMGKTRLLAKGDAVKEGDTLKSGKNASMQLRMADNGTIVLHPESELVIKSFAYNGVQDGSEHIALDLLSGGFRAITGYIGKLHKQNYSITTPNATVGIRGTDHETVFVGKTASGQDNTLAPGTYNHVISGGTLLNDEHGQVIIKPNQTGFAALDGANPVLVNGELPIFGDFGLKYGAHGELNGAQHDDKHTGADERHIRHEFGNGDTQNSGLNGAQSDGGQNNLNQLDRSPSGSLSTSPIDTDNLPSSSGRPGH